MRKKEKYKKLVHFFHRVFFYFFLSSVCNVLHLHCPTHKSTFLFYTYRLTFDFQHSLNELRKKKKLYTPQLSNWDWMELWFDISMYMCMHSGKMSTKHSKQYDFNWLKVYTNNLMPIERFTWKCQQIHMKMHRFWQRTLFRFRWTWSVFFFLQWEWQFVSIFL